jgi:hypothetical protein
MRSLKLWYDMSRAQKNSPALKKNLIPATPEVDYRLIEGVFSINIIQNPLMLHITEDPDTDSKNKCISGSAQPSYFPENVPFQSIIEVARDRTLVILCNGSYDPTTA